MGGAQALDKARGNVGTQVAVGSRKSADARVWSVTGVGGRGPLYEVIVKNGGNDGVVVSRTIRAVKPTARDVVVSQHSRGVVPFDAEKRGLTSHELEFVAEHLGNGQQDVSRSAIAEIKGLAHVTRVYEYGDRHTGVMD